jgi:hypothetical protein
VLQAVLSGAVEVGLNEDVVDERFRDGVWFVRVFLGRLFLF